MRHFSSYGPVESAAHFAVERLDLVDQCVRQLLGEPNESGGHYFTIWGPRQTGKTWIMRQAMKAIQERYGDKYLVGVMTLQGVIGDDERKPQATFLEVVPELFHEAFTIDVAAPQKWEAWQRLFRKKGGVFDRPVILLLDEFDCLPPKLIDRLVATFRKMYLARDRYWLHGLALVGVRAVLGVDSPRGSPFNVQRSLQIPNLTRDEVVELFRQYQSESGQVVEHGVVQAVYESTRGQPGLVGWFGELLTEKYNPGTDKPITIKNWLWVYNRALHVEWNNTLLNLEKKARGEHRADVMKLFTNPHVEFSMREEWCNFLFMNGIIGESVVDDPDQPNGKRSVCRFSSPFVQFALYSSFTRDMFGDKGPLPSIPLLDTLEDVFTPSGLCIPPLLERYRDYLKRLKEAGIDPWIGQPRRQDLHYTEAVGHFHLYAWLQNTLARRCSISPEFPTGNGKVDLVLRTQTSMALIEVKSLTQTWELPSYREQAARYAQKLGLSAATVAVFAPTNDESILAQLSSEADVHGVRVTLVALGWV